MLLLPVLLVIITNFSPFLVLAGLVNFPGQLENFSTSHAFKFLTLHAQKIAFDLTHLLYSKSATFPFKKGHVLFFVNLKTTCHSSTPSQTDIKRNQIWLQRSGFFRLSSVASPLVEAIFVHEEWILDFTYEFYKLKHFFHLIDGFKKSCGIDNNNFVKKISLPILMDPDKWHNHMNKVYTLQIESMCDYLLSKMLPGRLGYDIDNVSITCGNHYFENRVFSKIYLQTMALTIHSPPKHSFIDFSAAIDAAYKLSSKFKRFVRNYITFNSSNFKIHYLHAKLYFYIYLTSFKFEEHPSITVGIISQIYHLLQTLKVNPDLIFDSRNVQRDTKALVKLTDIAKDIQTLTILKKRDGDNKQRSCYK